MSSPIPILYRGSNRIIVLPLLLEDDATALLASALTYARIRLYQGETLVATYVRGTDNQLRNDPDDTDQLLLELTSTLTDSLERNLPLTGRLRLHVDDTDFEVDDDTFKDEVFIGIALNVL